ncbi:hypothetical protein BCR44DRAFT_1428572 [Catenaria anguillulae PL171]|uniref:Uncharacterized protein n=1 Tax=Catenaria anguillulae PL171 TaxID=765915 RepID=A0A1Y2HXB5_9FUNG|nr:hypothetical protein BCR44DRAFT_1428572 [Catenaria anguillulae PL171]
MGIRNMEGQRGAEFVFDSESDAKQFVLQAWIAIQDGVFASVAAEGAELRIGRGSV